MALDSNIYFIQKLGNAHLLVQICCKYFHAVLFEILVGSAVTLPPAVTAKSGIFKFCYSKPVQGVMETPQL